MSYPYSTPFALNSSELIIERIKAQETERRIFGNSVLAEVQGDLLQKSSTTSNNNSNANKDPNDDGKISLKEKIVNFGKGFVQPIKTIFESPKNMLITGTSVLGGAALIAATGGAAAPFMVAAGIIGGGVQIGKGIYKQLNAKTDAEAALAWQQMGSGTFTVGVSAAAAKGAMKAAKSGAPKGIQGVKNWLGGFKNIPEQIGNSVKNFSSKFSNFFKGFGKGTNASGSAPSGASAGTGGSAPNGSSTAGTKGGSAPKGSSTTGTNGSAPNNGSVNNNATGSASQAGQNASSSVNAPKSGTIINNADGDILAINASKGEQLALPSAKKDTLLLESKQSNPLLLEAHEEIKLLPEPPKYLMLEAPKTPSATASDAQQSIKPGFVSKIKKFLNIFGLFLDKE